MTCVLLSTTAIGQQAIGSFVLENGSIQIKASAEYRETLQNILNQPIIVEGDEVSAQKNPKEWLLALPRKYWGSYLRAQIKREPHEVLSSMLEATR